MEDRECEDEALSPIRPAVTNLVCEICLDPRYPMTAVNAYYLQAL